MADLVLDKPLQDLALAVIDENNVRKESLMSELQHASRL
jgi:hypothetical protein